MSTPASSISTTPKQMGGTPAGYTAQPGPSSTNINFGAALGVATAALGAVAPGLSSVASMAQSAAGSAQSDMMINNMQASNSQLLIKQIQVQNISTQFQSLSNIAKTEHETRMNSVRNLRA